MKRTLAYIVIFLIVAVVFVGVFNRLKGSKILDNTNELQELGLAEAGNQFVTIIRPTYGQVVNSPLTVQINVVDVVGQMSINLRDSKNNILSSEQIDITADHAPRYVATLEFVSVDGQGFIEVEFADDRYKGVRLPIKFQ